MLILIYEKGRVPKKKGRGGHPAKSAYADHCVYRQAKVEGRGR